MIENIKIRYIILYILFVGFQLMFLSPKMVVGTNLPILFAYFFGVFKHDHVKELRNKVNFDPTFLAILLSIASFILILSDVIFLGTTLMIITIAVLWQADTDN